jgi:hypothetical protein
MSSRESQGRIFLKQEKEPLFFRKIGKNRKKRKLLFRFGIGTVVALGLRGSAQRHLWIQRPDSISATF